MPAAAAAASGRTRRRLSLLLLAAAAFAVALFLEVGSNSSRGPVVVGKKGEEIAAVAPGPKPPTPLLSPEETRMAKITADIEAELDAVAKVCGDVCREDAPERTVLLEGEVSAEEAGFAPLDHKRINCHSLYKNLDLLDRPPHPDLTRPLALRDLSQKMKHFLSYGGMVTLNNYYIPRDFSGRGGKPRVMVWPKARDIDRIVAAIKANGTKTGLGHHVYGHQDTARLYSGLKKMNLAGKKVLVVGTLAPWVEELILSLDAAHVVTLEYRQISSNHDKITTYVPTEFANMYLNDTLGEFDAMVSFSSLEHSGLGRYGDAFNPWGDRITMARMWCVLKPGGHALIGFPLSTPDQIAYNAHRMYGPVMMQQMLANFKLVWTSHPGLKGGYDRFHLQGVFVAQAIK